MKNKNLISIALIIIALIAITIICGFAVFTNNNSTSSVYEIGRSTGKMARPYLFSLGFIALILISIRVIEKKFHKQH